MMEGRPLRWGIETIRGVRWAARRAMRLQLRVLVESRWRLGDEIMAIPIYEGIKRRYPFCHLTASCNFPDILARNPHVDRILDPQDKPSELAYDKHIVLRGAPRTVFRLDHYAHCAGIPTPPMNPRLYYDDWHTPRLAELGLTSKQFVAVCTGATWETKRWPIDQWQSLCEALASGGQSIVQLGRGDELIANVCDLIDQTTVREAACVLRNARLLISCDSGLMHLALAVGTPVLALFGPTEPAILVRENTPLTVLTNERECQGCWNHAHIAIEGVCPLGIHPCMGTLTAERVLERARELLRADA